MSSRKGGKPRGPPAHANRTTWIPDKGLKKNENEPGSRQRPLSTISAVCTRCRDQIAWKRKYGKYKMLTEPGKCASCTRRNVKDSYHAICRECASVQKVCAKCRRPSGSIIEDESGKEEAERARLEQALKKMRERDRRTLLRELAKPDASAADLVANARLKGSDGSGEDDDDDDSWEEADGDERDDDEESEGEEGGEGEDDEDDSDISDENGEGKKGNGRTTAGPVGMQGVEKGGEGKEGGVSTNDDSEESGTLFQASGSKDMA